MGAAKEMMIRQDDARRWALKTLEEAGVLESCIGHGDFFNTYTSDVTEAYRLANRRITEGLSLFSNEERREATDAIKAAYEEYEFIEECRNCERMMSKD